MEAKKLECYQVNGNLFVVDEDGFNRKCKLSSKTDVSSFLELSAIFKESDQNC